MKNFTKQELINAVLGMADLYNIKGYEELIKESTMPEVVKSIVYNLFLKQFNSYSCSDDAFDYYKKIRCYARILNEEGYYDFK